jgi:hypothetical protein
VSIGLRNPRRLFVISARDVLGGPSRLEALGEEGEQLFRGPEPAFLPRVDLLDQAIEMALKGLRVGAQSEDERPSHHMVTLRWLGAPRCESPVELPVKFPFEVAQGAEGQGG